MIQFGNVTIPRPITIASGPLTDKFSKIQAAREHGAGAVSLKLTFVQVPFQSLMRSYSIPNDVIISPTNKRLDMGHGVELMKKVKAELDIVMFANFSAFGTRLDEWQLLSENFAAAGTDILELNFCCPNLDTSDVRSSVGKHADHGGASICDNCDASVAILGAVKKVVDIPVIVKVISGDPSRLLQSCAMMEEAGLDGVHVVGVPMSGLPPLDEEGRPVIPLLKGTPPGSANGAICKYSSYLMTAKLAQVVSVPIMVSGGLMTWRDCIDAILWGACAPSICSAAMWYGWEVVESMNMGIEDYMARKGYNSLDDFRGKALEGFTTPDKVQLLEGHSVVDEDLCIGCGRCTKPAHCDAVTMVDGKAKIDEEKCQGCGVCWSLCPTGAITYKEEGIIEKVEDDGEL